RFGEVLIQFEDSGRGARDLGHLDGVRQPVAKMIGDARREHLHLSFEAAEGARVDNPVAVALERVAIGVGRFGILPAPALGDREPQTRQHSGIAYCGGSWPYRDSANCPTGPATIFSGSSSLRASAGRLMIR